jgi:hypothetical protein
MEMSPCESRVGRKRVRCGGAAMLRDGYPGSVYAVCTCCGRSTGGNGSDWSRSGAEREWNRVQALEAAQATERRLNAAIQETNTDAQG